MRKNILDLINERIVLMDGGMGTMLIADGLKENEVPENWNLEHPDKVARIHSYYYDAGSDIVQTNTFGGNRLKLNKKGLGEKTYEINFKAAKLAIDVCPESKYVAGDIGPTGEFLQPSGIYKDDDFIEIFKEQTNALKEGGVHILSIETMFDIREAISALVAVKKISNLPVFVEVTFNCTPRGFFTMMGDSVEKCMKELELNGADAVGSNCTNDSTKMLELLKEIKKHTKLPVIIQPNAGQPQIIDNKVVYEQSILDFTENIKKMIDEGVNIIGGCCGTNPEYIKEICKIINK